MQNVNSVKTSRLEYEPPWDNSASPLNSRRQKNNVNYVNTHIDITDGATASLATVKLDEGGDGQAVRPKERSTPTRVKQVRNSRLGNYEEPWDLTSTRTILEEAFHANKIQVSPSNESPAASSNLNETPTSQFNSQDTLVDGRPQEGYEKPWDWKPHKKVI